jgi:hypothetical protein
MAHYIDGAARVRLMAPPPLEKPLQLLQDDAVITLLDGDLKLAEARPCTIETHVPDCPTMSQAEEMSLRYGGFRQHAFSTCFVCGPDRSPGDGLRVFPGLSADGSMVACVWQPDASLADKDGWLHAWAVWSALDCPSGWAFLHQGGNPALLGEFAVDVMAPIKMNQQLIVIGWQRSQSGRKHLTGSALFSANGRQLARALATWIEIDPGRF